MSAPANGAGALVRSRTRDLSTLYSLAAAGQLYAVIDVAGRPDAYATLAAAGAGAAPLYAGDAGTLYAGVAPWLVQADPARCDWIGAGLAGEEGWGVFVLASAPHHAVRRQLRRLLTVRLPDGSLVRFRFYDGRVLPPFLRACTDAELAYVFGPIDGYAVVDALTQQVTIWDRAFRPALLPTERFAVQAAAPVSDAPVSAPDRARVSRPWAVAVDG